MISVNLIAVLISAITAMILGSLWYGPLFGKAWMELVGISKDSVQKSDMPKMYGAMFVGALIEAYVLAYFIGAINGLSTMNGINVALWAWLGFIATVMLGNYMFSQKPMKLYYIDGGYALVNLVVMGAIIGTLG